MPHTQEGLVRLRLLGPTDLRFDGGRELQSVLVQPKRLALLAYLAVAGRRGYLRRDRISLLFWPDQSQDRARAALSRAVYALRHALGQDAIASRGDDELSVVAERMWCDANAFVDAIDAKQWEAAATLYRGAFLDAFHISEVIEFERWMEDERARLASLYRRALESLAAAADHDRRLSDATAWQSRVVELLPCDASAVIRLMTLFERTGDLASAARTGAAYAATVASEFNAPPDSAVMTRLEALRGSLAQQQDTTVVAQSRFETHNFLTRDRLDVASAGAGVAAGDSALSGDELPGTRRLMASALARPRRRGRRTWLSFGATVALVAALGAGARLTRGKTAIAADARKVLVLPFENRTGIDSLRYVGQAAADWIESELMRSRLVDLVPQSVASLYLVSAKGEPTTDPGDIERIARKLGARFLVEGSEYAERDSLIFRARVVDVEQGTVLFAIGPITAARAELRPALAASGARVIGALASLVDDRLGVWARQSGPPPSLESYQLFAAGRELALHRRTADAITYYRRAYVLDTTWIAPLLATAEAYQGLDSVTRFDSTLQLVEMRRDRLTPLEAARVARDRALLNSDETGWLDGARLLNRLAPRSEFAFPLVADLWCAGRAHEGIQVLRQLDAGARWVQESQNYWTWQARLLHLDGEHEEELRVIRKARAVRPNLVRYVLYEVRALAALGRGRELDSLLEHARAMGPSEAVDPFVINSPFTLSLEAYDELVAHGYGSSDVAKHALTLFDDAYASLSASKREADQAVYAAIGRRQIAGDFAGAERLALAHRSIYGDSISVRENLGIFAARLGRREEALAQTRWLALLPERFDQRSPHMAAAHVFAVLHDTADALTSVRDAAASGAFCRGAISEDLHISPEFIALRGYRPLDRFRGSVD